LHCNSSNANHPAAGNGSNSNSNNSNGNHAVQTAISADA
jgi:hypothetical protein